MDKYFMGENMKKLTTLLIASLFLFCANISKAGDVQLYHDKAG